MADVVLASASPRRLELLRRIGVEPDVRPADVDETPLRDEGPVDYVLRLAEQKATAIRDDRLVIAADTIVEVDGELLGKPADRTEAAAMLGRLSGRDHRVHTGVCVRRGDRCRSAVSSTTVSMREIGADELAVYLDSPEPYDKAGAYAMQGAAGVFVTAIVGSDTNVIGLPLDIVVDLARDLGVDLFRP